MQKIKKIRYVLLGMLVMAVFSSILTTAIAAQTTRQLDASFNNIKIVIDGDTITPKDATGKIVEPFIVDGTTYLPVRAICEAVGYSVEWDGSTQTVYAVSWNIGDVPSNRD